MDIIVNDKHGTHEPVAELFNGERTAHAETARRFTRITAALSSAGYPFTGVRRRVPRPALAAVHDDGYLTFLAGAGRGLAPEESRYPSVFHPGVETPSRSPLAVLGTYATDMYTPIMAGTYMAAVWAASTAYEAALGVTTGRTAYALCRPPGHHAGRRTMGGYCYLNNTAVAAAVLAASGKTAVLDVDFHHGNGTQDIFWRRGDVLTVSVHADPDRKFPYYTGFSSETGAGAGAGANANFPLPLGTSDRAYDRTLEAALARIAAFGPRYLVVALGLDTHESDPVGGFRLTTPYYRRMAGRIAALGVPAAIVQEGGYDTRTLGENVVSFLSGWD
jgi:acetoin utilization deacetylase AcuC-like enzyme